MSNFLNSLQSLGKLTSSCKSPRIADPLKRMKANFIKRAQAQVNVIEGGGHHDGRSWFKSVDVAAGDDPRFIACLRNGTRLLPLGESTRYLELKSKKFLVQFFQDAIAACNSGELDDLFLQTMPKRKAGA